VTAEVNRAAFRVDEHVPLDGDTVLDDDRSSGGDAQLDSSTDIDASAELNAWLDDRQEDPEERAPQRSSGNDQPETYSSLD
jgi:hypothetical protein